MPAGRNWARDLRPASFRGVPFEVDDEGIRDLLRQAVHEIPNGSWTVERLGPGATEITLKGFVASDRADAQQAAIGATFKDDRPGPLIMPMLGPIQVSPIELSRDRSASKHGHVALNMRFVLAPPRRAGVSVDFLANQVFAAGEGLVGALTQQISAMIRTVGVAAYVVDAAVSGFSSLLAALQRTRAASRSTTAPAASAALLRLEYRVPEIAIDAARPALLDDFVAAAIALADGMNPSAVQSAFRPLRDVTAEPARSAAASEVAAAANAAAVASLARITALAVEAEAIARGDYAERAAAEAAMTGFVGRVDAEVEAIIAIVQGSGRRPAAASVVMALSQTRRAVVDHLGAVALDLAPRVTVEANESLPAIVWAWQLYADPDRRGELRRLNRVRRPAFMPKRFRALAPTVTTGRGP